MQREKRDRRRCKTARGKQKVKLKVLEASSITKILITMELERQCPHQSCKPNSTECNFEKNEVENDKIYGTTRTPKTNSNRSIIVPSAEESSSPFLYHWNNNNRRGRLFAVKALAIILLVGYIGHERWLGVVQKVSSRRRLTYVSSSNNNKKKKGYVQTTLGFPSSSKRSKTASEQQKQKYTSLESTNTTTTTSKLRGVSESSSNARDKPSSTSKDEVVNDSKRVSPKD